MPRTIQKDVLWVGAVDWHRRLFDALIPLPDGTSYNAYLVRGSNATALLDAVDPTMQSALAGHLDGVGKIDYLIHHHVEQDHSGSLPWLMGRYPEAAVLTSPKGRQMMVEHLGVDAGRIRAVEDGERVELGGKTLKFLHTPWVHWPETMCTLLEEEGILFSCDFFGSHLATSDLFVTDEAQLHESAKRYYAEIMMPFRAAIRKNLEKLAPLDIRMIAPSHGPIHARPAFIVDAYRRWTDDRVRNETVVAHVSMHGSTARMADALVEALAARGVSVHHFDLAVADIGKLAMALVDAGSIVLGTPTVLTGPHPLAFSAAYLVNALRPKVAVAGLFGSYGWGSRSMEILSASFGNLKVKLLEPVHCKGKPGPEAIASMVSMADSVAAEHAILAS
jgi:flavorubredoxin